MLKAFLRLQSLHWSHAATPNDGVVEADLHLQFYKIRTRTLAIHCFQGTRANTLLSLQSSFGCKESRDEASRLRLARAKGGDIIAGTLLCSSQSASKEHSL